MAKTETAPVEVQTPGTIELFELAKSLKIAKSELEKLESDVEAKKKSIEEFEKQMSAIMIEQDLQNFNRDGTTYFLNVKTFYSALAETKDALFKVLKRKGFGDLIKPTINAQTFNSFIKEQIEQNEDKEPKWLKGMLSSYQKTGVGMRKSANK